MIRLAIKCPHCSKINNIYMSKKKYDEYINQKDLIQNIFPDITPQEREILISGICPDCWNEIFSNNDEE